MLGVVLPASLKAAVDQAAVDRQMSSSQFVRILITRFFDEERASRESQAKGGAWPISKPRRDRS